MKILAIESSCDETAAAVIEDGAKILSNVVVSQIDIFAAYGGVIPEVAARSHLETILPVVHKALLDAGNLGKDDIDAIAVTHTPGLLGSLLIGTLTARMLAILWDKPLYAVHHLKSHIYANWLKEATASDISSSADALLAQRTVSTSRSATPASSNSPDAEVSCIGGDPPEFPLLALVVSGGHTQIIYMREHNQFEIIGTTRDDAVGECFDKVAKILGLPYPGGPSIDKEAAKGDPKRYKLPHPKVEGLDFSFSGLKTAVLRAVQAECGLPITTPSCELKNHLSLQQRADFAASFQATAVDILIEHLRMALEQHPEVKSVVLAGGVSASKVLREKVLAAFSAAPMAISTKNIAQEAAKSEQRINENCSDSRAVFCPSLRFTGDNAAMVGAAAYYEIMTGVKPTDPYTLNIAPRTSIEKA